jgi:hypothetical protein
LVITLENLAKKNPLALDYFPGGFTFKAIPQKGDFLGGVIQKSLIEGVR